MPFLISKAVPLQWVHREHICILSSQLGQVKTISATLIGTRVLEFFLWRICPQVEYETPYLFRFDLVYSKTKLMIVDSAAYLVETIIQQKLHVWDMSVLFVL